MFSIVRIQLEGLLEKGELYLLQIIPFASYRSVFLKIAMSDSHKIFFFFDFIKLIINNIFYLD